MFDRAIRTLILAAYAPVLAGGLAACDEGSTHLTGDPDGTADGRDEAARPEVEGSFDDAGLRDPGFDPGDLGEDGEAADARPECRAECPNDPPDSPIGEPCLEDTDCLSGLTCWPESVEVWDGETYTYWAGGYCASMGVGSAACSPDDPTSCPTGSTCIPFGDWMGLEYYGCMDLCSTASYDGVPWRDNCDCRDGYACDLTSGLCLSGCSNDRECCEIWIDANENGRRNAGEVTLLDASRCLDTCDPCSFTCTQHGCPGGDCAIGGPCEHDSDCPALATCWTESWGIPGGLCVLSRCDLVGRECPAGSGCANLGSIYEPYFTCMVPCVSGTRPGDEGYPCRDVAPAGPSPGDQACMPHDPSAWFDGTGADGYCYPGNFPGGDRPFGATCTEDSECRSPAGLGLCATWLGPGFCAAMCDERTARAGICEIDPAAPAATGVCFLSVCLETCDVPDGPRGANGCDNPTMACYAGVGLSGYLWVAEGRDPAPGFCYPACDTDRFCERLWGAGSVCDTRSGVCSI